jgi:hypothetical protein
MSEINALYGALHRSFAAVRRGNRIEAERWLGVAERVASMGRALKFMAKAEAMELGRISDPVDDQAPDDETPGAG